jgi:uncharacterized protein YlaN (UPF0358 family)
MADRIFNEIESLKIENATLQSQLIKEEERIVEYQQKLVNLARENCQLRNELLKTQNSELFKELGITSKARFIKMDDNRYKLAEEQGN